MKHRVNHVTNFFVNIQEHIVASIIAIFVVVGIGGIIVYRDSLFADITGANSGKSQALAQYASPLVYSIKDGTLIVTTTKNFTDAKSLSFFLMFDPKKIILGLENATSPFSYTYAPGLANMVQVTVFVKGDIAENSSLYTVPINGNVEDITITNAGILWGNDVFETLAIQKK